MNRYFALFLFVVLFALAGAAYGQNVPVMVVAGGDDLSNGNIFISLEPIAQLPVGTWAWVTLVTDSERMIANGDPLFTKTMTSSAPLESVTVRENFTFWPWYALKVEVMNDSTNVVVIDSVQRIIRRIPWGGFLRLVVTVVAPDGGTTSSFTEIAAGRMLFDVPTPTVAYVRQISKETGANAYTNGAAPLQNFEIGGLFDPNAPTDILIGGRVVPKEAIMAITATTILINPNAIPGLSMSGTSTIRVTVQQKGRCSSFLFHMLPLTPGFSGPTITIN